MVMVGIIGGLAAARLGPVPLWERTVFTDLEALGSVLGLASLFVVPYLGRPREQSGGPWPAVKSETVYPVYVTHDLIDVMLDLARRAEPVKTSIGLATTSAHLLDDDHDVPGWAPVFTHLVFPHPDQSTSKVFGVDLGTPPGETQGRFVSHPLGELGVSKRDRLHEIVIVAVPPWDEASIAAFDRSGRRHPLKPIEAHPPQERLPVGTLTE
jgi:hypothetical protein